MVRVRELRSEAFAAESKLRENRVLTLSSGNREGDAPPPNRWGTMIVAPTSM